MLIDCRMFVISLNTYCCYRTETAILDENHRKAFRKYRAIILIDIAGICHVSRFNLTNELIQAFLNTISNFFNPFPMYQQRERFLPPAVAMGNSNSMDKKCFRVIKITGMRLTFMVPLELVYGNAKLSHTNKHYLLFIK